MENVTHVTLSAKEAPLQSFARVAESDMATARNQDSETRAFHVGDYYVEVRPARADSKAIQLTASGNESPLATFGKQGESLMAAARRQEKTEQTFQIGQYEIYVKIVK